MYCSNQYSAPSSTDPSQEFWKAFLSRKTREVTAIRESACQDRLGSSSGAFQGCQQGGSAVRSANRTDHELRDAGIGEASKTVVHKPAVKATDKVASGRSYCKTGRPLPTPWNPADPRVLLGNSSQVPPALTWSHSEVRVAQTGLVHDFEKQCKVWKGPVPENHCRVPTDAEGKSGWEKLGWTCVFLQGHDRAAWEVAGEGKKTIPLDKMVNEDLTSSPKPNETGCIPMGLTSQLNLQNWVWEQAL